MNKNDIFNVFDFEIILDFDLPVITKLLALANMTHKGPQILN